MTLTKCSNCNRIFSNKRSLTVYTQEIRQYPAKLDGTIVEVDEKRGRHFDDVIDVIKGEPKYELCCGSCGEEIDPDEFDLMFDFITMYE
jgi:hypothetical protein